MKSSARHSNAKPTDERREHPGVYGIVDAVGRSYGFITCPFCASAVKVFLWSLAGCGKRCDCGALLTTGGAYKKAGG